MFYKRLTHQIKSGSVRAAKAFFTFVFLLIVWIALTSSLNAEELAVGAISAAFVSAFSYEFLFRKGVRDAINPKRWAYFLAYLPAYILAEIKAHAKVMYLILHPKMPIKPGIVRVPTNLKTDVGLTALANSITMTPGTLSVEVNEEKSCLFVHWIDVEAIEPEQTHAEIAKPFEKFLGVIFG
jgi:multicomponent Na+:H+ antiporter subunit E